MSDSAKSLELLIKTKADLAAAKAAQQQLEAIISKKKYLGQSYEKEVSQLSKVKGALDDYTAKTGETGEKVGELEANHHALHKIMHMIGSETAPELGEALTCALYGPIGGAIALGAAIHLVGRMFEEQKQKAEEAAQ